MENQNTEYKESWRDEYLKWICGFANAQGGKLSVGIDDHGTVCGVENAHRLSEDILGDVVGRIYATASKLLVCPNPPLSQRKGEYLLLSKEIM